ncbi:DUF3654 domain-containing protein [Encephalitozoon intestinalis]
MRWKKVLSIGFFGVIVCASSESSKLKEGLLTFNVKIKMAGSEALSFPLVFKGIGLLVMRPTTKFKDLKKDPEAMRDIKDFIKSGKFIMALWRLGVGNPAYNDDNRFEKMFDEMMGEYLKKVSEDLWMIYEKTNREFGELLVMAYERIGQCEKSWDRKIENFGKAIIGEIEKMIEETEKEEDEKRKMERMAMFNGIKQYGETLCNSYWWKMIVSAERIVCEICTRVYEAMSETELIGFLVEGNMNKLLIERKMTKEESQNYIFLESRVISMPLLLDAIKKNDDDVIIELIKQIMMGKDGEEIEEEYVKKVSDAVQKKRKAEEERVLKIEKELLGESEDSGGRKKKKSRGGAGRRDWQQRRRRKKRERRKSWWGQLVEFLFPRTLERVRESNQKGRSTSCTRGLHDGVRMQRRSRKN